MFGSLKPFKFQWLNAASPSNLERDSYNCQASDREQRDGRPRSLDPGTGLRLRETQTHCCWLRLRVAASQQQLATLRPSDSGQPPGPHSGSGRCWSRLWSPSLLTTGAGPRVAATIRDSILQDRGSSSVLSYT